MEKAKSMMTYCKVIHVRFAESIPRVTTVYSTSLSGTTKVHIFLFSN